ncbi:hypothetical protein MJ585_27850 [Klebsiella pneumoniae]|nr:hypothetical protein MJ585_27850 [Klebsiella pneumoniae]
MDSQRNLLIIALLFVSFMIWQAREQGQNPQPPAADHADYDHSSGSAADQGVPASGQVETDYG